VRLNRIIPLQPQTAFRARPCIEIGGGHQRAQRTITVPGLDARILADPLRAGSGGDVYSIASNSSGGRSRFLLADVSGHGERAQPRARRLCNLIARLVEITDCVRLARAINRELASIAADDEFATALVMTYSRHTHRLSICNAGHPRPLLYRARRGEWQLLGERVRGRGPCNLPFGVLADSRYTAFEIQLERDDLVLLYTDALSDAQAADGRDLGEEGVLDVVRGLGCNSVRGLPAALVEAVACFRDGAPRDDQTVMALHRSSWMPVLLPARSAARRAILRLRPRRLLRG